MTSSGAENGGMTENDGGLGSKKSDEDSKLLIKRKSDENNSWRDLILTTFVVPPKGVVPSGLIFGTLECMSTTEAVYFGGADEFQSYSELILFDITSGWRLIEEDSIVKPTCRFGHASVFYKHRLFVFGGVERIEEEVEARNPVFLPPLELPPDSTGNSRLWCHRGAITGTSFVFNFESAEWEKIPEMPIPTAFHTATLIGHRYVFIHGGCTDSELTKATGEAYVLDLESMSWSVVSQGGDVPGRRYGHKCCYSESDHRVYLFGGNMDDDDGENGILYSLNVGPVVVESGNVGELEWNIVEYYGRSKPSNRIHHALESVGNRILCFSGQLKNRVNSDSYCFDLNNRRWTRPLQEGEMNLAGHSACVMGGTKILIVGGCRAYSLDPATAEVLMAISSQPECYSSDTGGISSSAARIVRQARFATIIRMKKEMLRDAYKGKLVVLGDSAVGKSCLLERFAEDYFDTEHPSTVGFDFFSVTTMVKGKIVGLQLWDTAGQERFDGVTGTYYRNADGFVFVYDSTRRSTYNHVERWIRRVKEYHAFGTNCLKLIIGNKQDLNEEVQVTNEEGMRLADEIGGIYLGTSAKTGDGVDLAFLIAAAQLIQLRVENPANKSLEFRLESASLDEPTTLRSALSKLGSLCGTC